MLPSPYLPGSVSALSAPAEDRLVASSLSSGRADDSAYRFDRTVRRLASIWANGVTIRSSWWPLDPPPPEPLIILCGEKERHNGKASGRHHTTPGALRPTYVVRSDVEDVTTVEEAAPTTVVALLDGDDAIDDSTAGSSSVLVSFQ